MNRIIQLFLSLLAGAMLIACSNEDEAIELPIEGLPMMVEVSETPMTDADTGQPVNASTRGDVITSTSFNNFKMSYGGCDQTEPVYTANKNNDVWTVTGNWPSNHSLDYSFYAYNDGTYNEAESPYVHFTVDGTPTNQKDLLVAKTTTSYDACSGKVPLSFNHACAAVQFKIYKTTEMSDYKIEVNEAALCNVINEGDYYFTSDTWTLGSTKTNYTLNTASFPLTTTPTNLNAASGTEYLFMIPQTLTAWDKTEISGSTTGCYLRLNCTIKKGSSDVSGYSSNAYAYLPVGGSWTKGTKYIITLKVGTALRNASGTQIIKL